MKTINSTTPMFFRKYIMAFYALALTFLFQTRTYAQTFDFPSDRYVDSLSLQNIVSTVGSDIFYVEQGHYGSMSGPTTGSGFTVKSLIALTSLKVNVQSPNVGQRAKFTYLITYDVYGITNPATGTYTTVYTDDTLSISYDRDSLQLINDRAFKIAGAYHKLKIVVKDVVEVTGSGSTLTYTTLSPSAASTVPSFVYVYGDIFVQEFSTYSSLAMSGLSAIDSISSKGIVHLQWSGNVKPAGYEVEWTYTVPGGPPADFRNNATRIFTNNNSFNIPVARKEGTLSYRVRMVRPSLTDLLSRSYGAWSSGSAITIANSAHDGYNWDLKMNFVEDGKYKEVMTYYDGLLKPKQVQTRFNSKPTQTIIAQSLYDYQGRAVINSLPIPVNNTTNFSYLPYFMHPASATEYDKLSYDGLPDTTLCPPREIPIPPLASNAVSNQYYSRNNIDTTGKNAYIPDAENYPVVRKIFAAENSEKVLFEGQAGSTLQLGNDRQTQYLYGSPLQAELNRYFGQDIGRANYYRKMITTDAHNQDMFSITDNEGKMVASGLIGTPDATTLALSVRNSPVNKTFKSNLLPVPNNRMGDFWWNNGSYFVESQTNYTFQYKIEYVPFKPCSTISVGLMPKIHYFYEVVDNCGNIKLQQDGALGGVGVTTLTNLSFAKDSAAYLFKGNHLWNKLSYIELDDLNASVDQYLETTGGCYKSFDQFLKEEFLKAQFPCTSVNDPCGNMRLSMIKEMYPRAKYGQYNATTGNQFLSGTTNSIFSYAQGQDRYLYQADSIQDNVVVGGKTYNLKQTTPQKLIEIFNDSVGAALLPLHPDYCKLKLCGLLNNPYAKVLSSMNSVSAYTSTGVAYLADLVNNDPLLTYPFLSYNELSKTAGDSNNIDDEAFQKTVCGSEMPMIESVCNDINSGMTAADISHYPDNVKEEYFRNLIDLYVSNREARLAEKMRVLDGGCGPCGNIRLKNLSKDTSESGLDDNTVLASGVDSVTTRTGAPVTTSFGTFLSSPSSITADDLNNLKNGDNSISCQEMVDYIGNTLATCNVTQAKIDELKDTIKNRFCIHDNSITTLTYDSLTSMMTSVGIATNDLCNAGIVDLKKITRASADYVELGLLQYSPLYYQDLAAFFDNNQILDFISGSLSTMSVSMSLCDAHPFQQNIAKALGATLTPTNCTTTVKVDITKTTLAYANAVKLKFTIGKTGPEQSYYLYPTKNDTNALHSDFGTNLISHTSNFKTTSLFNVYGFSKVSGSFANRNTTMLNFKGDRNGVNRDFTYFLSAFNENSDYNMMEKDRQDYLNGVSCREFIPLAKDVITTAEALNIKVGHPYFETFFTNMFNYRNNVNFDFNNYSTALQTCAVSDSMVIKKNIAHFKIRFPSGSTVANMDSYLNTLRVTDTVGITDVQGYQSGGYNYMLLNVSEANGKTIKDAKLAVQSRLPSGSVLTYLPYLNRDTVAMMLSSNFNPMGTSLLHTAFPAATIDSEAVNIYYFIPGCSTITASGKLIYMMRSIASNYDYSHYVDDIYKYVGSTAPMTTMFSHAESSVSPQYYDWQMTAWRNYMLTLPVSDHNAIVKGSKAEQFQTLSASGGGYSFSNSYFSYRNGRTPYYLNTLYIDHNAANPNYTYLVNMLFAFNGYTYPQYLFRNTGKNSPVSNLVATGSETRGFKCADSTVFWINHFKADNQMVNVFVKLPDYLPLPRNVYTLTDVRRGFDKDSVTYLNLTLIGQQGTKKDTLHCMGYTNLNMGQNYAIPSAFLTSLSQYETASSKFSNCETNKLNDIYISAKIRHDRYKDSARYPIVEAFRQDIIKNVKEYFTIEGFDIKNGVTLYYYDMAGNLVKTVPPAGVAELDVSGLHNDTINDFRNNNELTSPKVPTHTKPTIYRYNAQNKVIYANTPDGGVTTSRYDLMGRVMISQNDKQKPNNEYTYFLYDDLSRVVETGVVYRGTAWTEDYFVEPAKHATFVSDIKKSYRKEVTVTMYDTASYKLTGAFTKQPPQENLKNRVACTKYFDAVGGNVDASKDTTYTNAMHYSYDVSGNVKTLIHDMRLVTMNSFRFKRVDYEYDLYSGKVILLSYNRGSADQFYQKYKYDSDNRITDVYTSGNGIVWDRDGHYNYYDHGPLARTEVGEQRVQGIDYAYTINGWLKAINGVQNAPQADMGKDGGTNMVMPQDVFSQRIDYFPGDYKAIKDSNIFRELPATPKALYNGNIAAIATSLAPFGSIYSKYFYDPLQRIDHADYSNYNYNYSTSVLTKTDVPDYASNYTYDKDGNLLALNRQGGTVSAAMNGGTAIPQQRMDSFTYRYTANTNRLRGLTDNAAAIAYKIDIPPYNPVPTTDQYLYDATGNLTKDLVTGLTNIDWNSKGKVSSVTRLDGSKLFFTYDAMGNRQTKELVTYPATNKVSRDKTIYVRDATGNMLAVYEDKRDYDVQNLGWPVIIGNYAVLANVTDGGLQQGGLGYALADEIYNAHVQAPTGSFASLMMAMPQLSTYAADPALLQNLVTTLPPASGLDLVKSMPDITRHALDPAEGMVPQPKLSAYLQPVMLSQNQDGLQTDIFTTLKATSDMLYNNVVMSIPASPEQKQNFPDDPSMLMAYKNMDVNQKLMITNNMAQSLTAENASILPDIKDVLLHAYSSTNTDPNFVMEIPNSEFVLDQLKQDANDYISWRYAQPGVSADSAAAPFVGNSVLASALTAVPAPDVLSLAQIMQTQFSAVMSMANTSGQTSTLLNAFTAVTRNAGNAVAQLYPWYRYSEVLQNQDLYLAEHHIYGSSRLGMQKYLPSQYHYSYGAGQNGGSTSEVDNLSISKPWYSLYGNDLFNPATYTTTLNTGTMSSANMGVTSHILGNRQYELPNHLGNVQATILDRVTPTLDQRNALTGYRSDISLANDYYPYGMLMPGRYISDTSGKCVTVSATVLVPQITRVDRWRAKPPIFVQQYRWGATGTPTVGKLPKAASFADETIAVYYYNPLSMHTNGTVLTIDSTETGQPRYIIDQENEPTGMTAFMQIHADTNQAQQQFGFTLNLNPMTSAQWRVRQYTDSNGEAYEDAVPWMAVAGSGPQVAWIPINKNAVKAGGNTIMELRLSSAIGSAKLNGATEALSPYIYITSWVPETRLARVCDDKDNYRFGFNGQEKVNEIAGIGNHNTAMFWEYDTRLGRRWNMDPEYNRKNSQSTYATNSNNPIWFEDPLGNLESTHTDNEGNVLAVYNDGDNGVYKHENNADGKAPTRAQIDIRHGKSTSAGGEKMGETEYWDEFADIKTKEPVGSIIFSHDPRDSWHPLIDWGHERSNNQDLFDTKSESGHGGILDIKLNTDWAPAGPMTGRILNGKYATARSAGNFLAGLNGVTGRAFGPKAALTDRPNGRLSGITYMKLAGAYQVRQLSTINALKIVLRGVSFGPSPYYGEEEYSGRRIAEGIQAGEKELKEK